MGRHLERGKSKQEWSISEMSMPGRRHEQRRRTIVGWWSLTLWFALLCFLPSTTHAADTVAPATVVPTFSASPTAAPISVPTALPTPVPVITDYWPTDPYEPPSAEPAQPPSLQPVVQQGPRSVGSMIVGAASAFFGFWYDLIVGIIAFIASLFGVGGGAENTTARSLRLRTIF